MRPYIDEEMADFIKTLAGVLGVVSGVITLAYYRIRHYKRRFESDGVTATAQDQLIIRLQEREKANLDRAERAELENKTLIIQVGELKADTRVLTEKLDNVKAQIADLHNELAEARRILQKRRRGDAYASDIGT